MPRGRKSQATKNRIVGRDCVIYRQYRFAYNIAPLTVGFFWFGQNIIFALFFLFVLYPKI